MDSISPSSSPSSSVSTSPFLEAGNGTQFKSNSTNSNTPSTSRPRSKSHLTSGAGGHKRGSSGTFLSKFPFFRNTPSTSPDRSPADSSDTIPFPSAPSTDTELLQPRHPVLASVIEAQSKSRKRKGSLRKTALLTGGRLRLDRRSSNVEAPKRSPTYAESPKREPRPSQASPTKRTFGFELPDANSSSDTFLEEQQRLSLDVSTTLSPQSTTFASPFTSPIAPYASTTSDDDGLLLPPSSIANGTLLSPPHAHPHPSPSPSPPSSESSLTAPLSPQRRRATKPPPYVPGTTSKPSLTSPLTATINAEHPTDESDYSETEWWGWIILLVTWIVVVVGMGSCLGVWSWAWDVGRTPYAPPELEDDPTLPIVGYYPALMVLTAVMSWVWVVVAWVGMKYFKHAKIQSEDST